MPHYIKEIYGIDLNLINKNRPKDQNMYIPDWTWKHSEFDQLGLKISSNIGGDCVGARWGRVHSPCIHIHSE